MGRVDIKIAILNGFNRAPKNRTAVDELKKMIGPMGHQVYSIVMGRLLADQDIPEVYTPENPYLTCLRLGIQAVFLLNSNAVDFIVTGCGIDQGALMSLSMYPGVVCDYCIESTDAYLSLQTNNGNALSVPYVKGFGWDAELNLDNTFTRAFGSPKGMGYPDGHKEAQGCNTNLLFGVKKQTIKPLLEVLESIDPQLIRGCMIPGLLECFYEGYKDEEVGAFVDEVVKL